MALPLDTGLRAVPPQTRGATPESAPLEMPTQALDRAPVRRVGWPGLRVAAARLVVIGGALVLTWYGYRQMTLVFGHGTSTPLQGLLLVLFTITFGWISLSASQAVAGLLAQPWHRDAETEGAPSGRTAILMPVYNEDPAATTAALYAMADGLARSGHGDAFEIFILSDTTSPDVWVSETTAYDWLRDKLGEAMHVWYRRRDRNIGRKAGNLQDFVERWGARYDYMLVLDADSIMAPETILSMARRMDAAPRLGILQTVPMAMGGRTLFARLQQFAGRLYGPVIARGVSAWQGLDGNYWGHNAMIRVRAFAENCGLPQLPGRPPFGGHVLSHDFVEAALIRRGGWEVRMDADLEGSWEGAPPSLIDFAVRDRRWAQGNLQHSKVIGARGLTLSNRLHFAIGIGSYLMSPIWLAMLVTGALLTGQSLIYQREYFSNRLQLFPDWPIFDAQRMIWLFALSMGLLLLPKILGALRAILLPQLRQRLGGPFRIIGGASLEILLSALFAPVLMLMQVRQLWGIVAGVDGGWSAQCRDGKVLSWAEAISCHKWHVALGLVPAILLFDLAPGMSIWVAPVLAGWIAAPILSRMSGDPRIGRAAWLLAVPEDRAAPEVAVRAAVARRALEEISDTRVLDLARDPARCAVHAATLPAHEPEPSDEGKRLAAITARAKIEAATDALQAIRWMDRDETIAMLSSSELLGLLGGSLSSGPQPAPALARLRVMS